jgi:hypothetical protein
MAGSGIYYTIALENLTGEFEPSLTLATGDVQITIMDAAGNMSALANVLILPVNDPAGSVIYKGEFDTAEMALADVRDVPFIEVIFIDVAGNQFRPAVYSYDGQAKKQADMFNLLEADQIRVGTSIKYYLKGSSQTTLLLEQDLEGSSSCATDVSIIGL